MGQTILLQGHAVTLTFKIGRKQKGVHIVHISTNSRNKFHAPSIKSV